MTDSVTDYTFFIIPSSLMTSEYQRLARDDEAHIKRTVWLE